MKENANEKRLSLIENVLALSDEEVLKVILTIPDEPDATTQSHETGHPSGPPPDPPPGGGQ